MHLIGAHPVEVLLALTIIALAGWLLSYLLPTRHLKNATHRSAAWGVAAGAPLAAVLFYFCGWVLHVGYIRCLSLGRRGKTRMCGASFTDDDGKLHPFTSKLVTLARHADEFWLSYAILATAAILLIAVTLLSYRQLQYLKAR